jgi:hypothetical protein
MEHYPTYKYNLGNYNHAQGNNQSKLVLINNSNQGNPFLASNYIYMATIHHWMSI